MVEEITASAFRNNLQKLQEANVLTSGLSQDLARLAENLDKVSNWDTGEIYLKQADISSVEAGGPMSKVFRILACTMESLGRYTAELADGDLRIARIEIIDPVSGCSTYSGRLRVQASRPDGREEWIVDGPFLWDCAAHGIPQVQAAQEMGYRCIVDMPEVSLPISPSRAQSEA